AARASIEQEARATPPSIFVNLHRAGLAAIERDYAASEQYLRELKGQANASPSLEAFATEMLARASERNGKIGEAGRYLKDQMAISEDRGLPQESINNAASLAEFEITYRNKPTAGLSILSDALAKHPLDSIAPLDRPLPRLAWVYAEAGKVDVAKRLMRQFETEVPEGMRRGMWLRHWPEG